MSGSVSYRFDIVSIHFSLRPLSSGWAGLLDALHAKPKMMTATIYVVDDDEAVCDSLRFLMDSAGYRVVTFADAAGLLGFVENEDMLAGCLIADLRLPGPSGLDMHDQLRRRGVMVPTIMITGHGDVPAAVRAIKAGIVDFLEKPFSDSDLLDRVRSAVKKDDDWRRDRQRKDELRQRYQSLSPKEHAVMWEVVKGKLNKQIAEQRNRSEKTIEVHRSSVMKKMQAKNLAALVKMSIDLDDQQ